MPGRRLGTREAPARPAHGHMRSRRTSWRHSHRSRPPEKNPQQTFTDTHASRAPDRGGIQVIVTVASNNASSGHPLPPPAPVLRWQVVAKTASWSCRAAPKELATAESQRAQKSRTMSPQAGLQVFGAPWSCEMSHADSMRLFTINMHVKLVYARRWCTIVFDRFSSLLYAVRGLGAAGRLNGREEVCEVLGAGPARQHRRQHSH